MKILKYLVLLVPFYFVVQLLYSGFFLLKSRSLVERTHTGDFILGRGPEYLMLVAGDSVGAGIGASSFDTSLVGRTAKYLSKNRTVKLSNKSVSGYRMHDLLRVNLPSREQDLILLVISSNDLFHFTDLNRFKKDTGDVLKVFAPKAKKVILIGPGRIFDAGAIPLFLKPVYKILGKSYANILTNESKRYKNVIYVDPLEADLEKELYPATNASDNFHPNDEGHKFWFDLIKNGLN